MKNKVLVLIVISFTLIFFYRIKNNFFDISDAKYFVICDQIFSDEVSDNIKKFIKTLKLQFPKDFFESLKKNFSVINSIKLLRKSSNKFITTIYGEYPNYKINEDYVFTSSGKVISKNFFNYNLINDLQNVSINNIDLNIHNPELLEFLKNISNIVELFDITWINKNYIKLFYKIEDLFLIIDYQYLPTKKIIEDCINIKNKFLQNQTIKIKNQQIFCDLRFANQIIISLVKGEEK